MRFLAPALATLCLTSCISELDVPSSAKVTCGLAQPTCPDGFACDAALGLCLPTTPPTGPGPALEGSAVVQPPVIGAHRRFSVTFSTNNALIGAPALTLVSGAFSAPLTYVSGQDIGPYVFVYEASGGEAEGVATIRGTLADAQGRVARDVTIGTVGLDFTAPIVDAVTVDEAVVAGGVSWVDTVTLTLRPVLPVGGEVPAAVVISGTVAAPAELTYATTLPTTLLPGDGSKLVNVQLIDAAGNVTAVAIPLSLDTATPSNTVVIDTPAPPDVYLNADSLTVFFHSSGQTPLDFAGYVFSTNSGATWSPTSTLGALALPTITADATTTLWIRESDLFGNLTLPGAQGVLAIHEDSQVPSAPFAFTHVVSGLLTSEAGVLLDGSRDPGGGPVTYEVLGGPYADYTAVSSEPRIILPGAASGGTTVYVIRAVDRAGNASTGVTVSVADTPFMPLLTTCSGGCFPYDFRASGGFGTFASVNPNINQNLCAAAPEPCRSHELNLCRKSTADTFGCSSKSLATSTSSNFIAEAITMGGLVLSYADFTTQLAPVIRAMDVGPDESLQTADDGAAGIVMIGNGSCQAATTRGIFWGNSTNNRALTFYNFGNDKSPGTGDAGEGNTVVNAASRVTGFNPCTLQSDPRHVMWNDDRSGNTRSYVYNLGADGKPGGGDDGVPAEWLVPTGDSALLSTNRVLVREASGDWTVYSAGADQVFGSGDDPAPATLFDIPWLADAEGDKAYSVSDLDVMLDLTTNTTVAINNQTFGGADLLELFASDTMLFGSLSFGGGISRQPGAYAIHGEPLTFQVANVSGENAPSGIIDGGFYAFMDGVDVRPTFLNTQAGGHLQLNPGVSSLTDMDVDGGYWVWLDQPGAAVMIYYAGADGIPGTGDDKGPTQIVGPGTYRWPRIDGHIIVWADLSNDADGLWVGANLDSRLKALDLGADGWIGGGDDVAYSPAAGTKAVMPDITGNIIAYFDYAGDGTGLCEGSRGAPQTGNCTPAIATLTLGSAPTTVVAGGTPRADLRREGNRIVFSEFTGGSWNVRIHTLGGGTVTAVATANDERVGMLVGESLAYYAESTTPGEDGVFVVDSGVDTTFGTADDVVRKQPANITPRGCGAICAMWDGRPNWYDGEVVASGGGLMPVDTAFDTATGGTSLPLVDNGTFNNSATLAAPPWQHIEDLRVHVVLTHAAPAQLELRLVSPQNETVVLASPPPAVGNNVNKVFTVENAPNLFGLHGDPLPGTWKLEVQDKVAGSTGTLTSWSIKHRR